MSTEFSKRALRHAPRGSITRQQMAEGIFQQAFKGGEHGVKLLQTASDMLRKAQLENALYRSGLQYCLALLGGGVVVHMGQLQSAILNRKLSVESNPATHEMLMRISRNDSADTDEDLAKDAPLAVALYQEMRRKIKSELG